MHQVLLGALSTLSFRSADFLAGLSSRRLGALRPITGMMLVSAEALTAAFMLMDDFRRVGFEGAPLSAVHGIRLRLGMHGNAGQSVPAGVGIPAALFGAITAITAAALPSPTGRYNLQNLRPSRRADTWPTSPAQNMRSFAWPIRPSGSRGFPLLDQHLKTNHLLRKRRDS